MPAKVTPVNINLSRRIKTIRSVQQNDNKTGDKRQVNNMISTKICYHRKIWQQVFKMKNTKRCFFHVILENIV
jgi:L-lactate utilization protein LutB